MTSSSARHGLTAALLAAVLALCACSQTTPAVEPAADAKVDAEGFPSVYRPLYAATTQMSSEEASAQEQSLSGLSSRRASGAISEAEYRRRVAAMRALGANHGAETLQEIGN